MNTKSYSFISLNDHDIEISIIGECTSGCKDFYVSIDGATDHEFFEVCNAYELFEWIVSEGVTFDPKALYVNVNYVDYVMIQEEANLYDILLDLENLSDEDLRSWHEHRCF